MRTDKPPLKQRALQKLLLRRFGMAAGTYLLGLVLLWLALLSGFYRAAPTSALPAFPSSFPASAHV
ncbi:hypothetical protein ACLBVK_29705, partial [Pseudomonas aeruginosa]